MSFVEKLDRARVVLEQQGRLSLRALARELEAEDAELEDIVAELLEVQGVVRRDGKVLVWQGDPTRAAIPTDSAAFGEPRSYTPRHLAEKILSSRSAMEGEHKQVTVLFCDVANSMVLADRLGQEEWHRTLDDFFAVLTTAVHAYEGTVNQYTGDGVMALFGAPVAHEDHARRACLASLEIQRQLRELREKIKEQYELEFAARIGLNSGDVVVGKIGDDLRMDYTAQGPVVGIAARLEARCPPHGVLIAASTGAQVEGLVDLRPLGPAELKGVDQPVEVSELLGSRELLTRFDVSRRRGLSRFVGREADMAMLEAALAQAREGNGQVVGVVAEAGTGKSRLCHEFLERCRGQGMTVLEGPAVAHGRNIPYLPMLQIFRAYYGIAEDDEPRQVREKIAGRLLLIDPGYQDRLDVIFEFFGVPDPARPVPAIDPEAKQRQLFEVLRDVVRGGDPQVGQMIAFIEDLHWLDAGSEAFLAQWVDALAGSQGLLLVNFRPEYHAAWMQRSYYRQLPLAPLSESAVRELLRDLLGDDASVAELADAVYRRTGGNPFFCEEVVSGLRESGQLAGHPGSRRVPGDVGAIELPPSVQAILAARIDRLTDDEKQVLQTGAVIGRQFGERLLHAVCRLGAGRIDAALSTLQAREFLYPDRVGGEPGYRFRHALTQEVALSSQLAERRRELHAQVARALEARAGDQANESWPLIAHHWADAGEGLAAARWYCRAGEAARAVNVRQSALLFEAALHCSDAEPDSDARAEIRLPALTGYLVQGAWRMTLEPERRRELVDEAVRLYRAAGNRDLEVYMICIAAWMAAVAEGEIDHFERTMDAVVRDMDGVSPVLSAIVRGGTHAHALFLRGRFDEMFAEASAAASALGGDYAAGREIVNFSALAAAQIYRVWGLVQRGELREAAATARAVLDALGQGSQSEDCVWVTHMLGAVALYSGGRCEEDRWPELLRADHLLDVAERNASEYTRVHARVARSYARLVAGKPAEALEAATDARDHIREHHAGLDIEAYALTLRAEAATQMADWESSRAFAREAIALADERGFPLGQIWSRLLLATACHAIGGSDAEADVALAAAGDLLVRTNFRPLAARLAELRARRLPAAGEQARAALAAVRDRYREMGAHAHAARLTTELDLE